MSMKNKTSVYKSMCEKTKRECIECNLCKDKCDFLKKYNMNLKCFTEKKDLASNCFLCDECKLVCPKKLSGKEIAIELKQNKKNNLTAGVTSFLKNHFIGKNVSKQKSKTLLFLGCNFPAFYPATAKRLVEIASKKNIDFMIDCCKKPIEDVGGKVSMNSLEKVFEIKQTKKLICVCPNCYYFFKHKLNLQVESVFQFLLENNIGENIFGNANIFIPCPDKKTKEIFIFVQKFFDNCKTSFTDVQCCGLGGGAGKNDVELLASIKNKLYKHSAENIYTYCSSCASSFQNFGLPNVKYILAEILGVKEKIETSFLKGSLKSKFISHK